MLGELRACTLSSAPLVDYENVQEFHCLCHLTEARYARLIFGVVDNHTQSHLRSTRFAWSLAEEMLMGLSVFPELHDRGVQVLLGLTHKRGLRFIRTLNNSIVVAGTIACRTCCDQYKDHTIKIFMEQMAKGAPPVLADMYVAKVKEHMI